MVEQEVFTGVWRDYSHDGLRQLTLTVPLTYGGYLISALTLLVSLAGSRFWYMMTFFLHQMRAHPEGRSDPVHAQTQTLLRNSITATSALTDVFLLSWAWSGTGMGMGRRLAPILFAATACLVLFTLAGTFVSSAVTQKTPDVVVLAKAPGCGAWDVDMSSVYSSLAPDPNQTKILADDAMDARLYAKWFYADMPPSSIPTSTFPIKRLPYLQRMTECPFTGQGRCLSNDTSTDKTALVLDTGRLDSHLHLGLNAARDNRVEIRKVTTCSPVYIDDLVDITVNSNMSVANFTGLTNNQNDVFSINKHSLPLTLTGYFAGCSWFSGLLKGTQWPAAPFDRNDADLSLCYVGQESVVYPSPVYDPLFLANGSRTINRTSSKLYLGSNYINLIGCMDQIQFCNPVTGKCTNVTHPAAAWVEAGGLQLNQNQLIAVNRSTLLVALTGTATHGLGSLGAAGLQARDFTSRDVSSTALPNNQWQNEAKLWFETGLAMLQGHIIRFLGRIDLSSPYMYGRYLVYRPLSEVSDKPLRDACETACRNQKVTTTNRYQNFNFSALMLVVCFSFLIILASLMLESIVSIVRRARVTQKGQWRQDEWDSHCKYWLLKAAMESAGIGPWTKTGRAANAGIPVLDRRAVNQASRPRYEHVKSHEAGDEQVDDFLRGR